MGPARLQPHHCPPREFLAKDEKGVTISRALSHCLLDVVFYTLANQEFWGAAKPNVISENKGKKGKNLGVSASILGVLICVCVFLVNLTI